MSRAQRRRRATRPDTVLGAGLTLGAVLAFVFLSRPGEVNVLGTGLLCLTPLVDAGRNLAVDRLLDEYERSLMLRAVALAFNAVMVGLFVLGMLGAASLLGGRGEAETVPALLLILLFLGGWVVFGLGYVVLQRRETRA
ncbi:hypothetical protein [Deinococcus planocerae]|uniref:hypothetical protein n=1 Tax=Deinococcus planocerae TaxID=1737569 RepID=UPI000C7F2251|nr:hypothetical protein [Deinococcus planocerae]